MQVKITVESMIAGDSEGYLILLVDDDEPVICLVNAYCSAKGIERKSGLILYNSNYELLNIRKSLANQGIENGDIVYLSPSSAQTQLFGFTSWWGIAAIALLLGLGGIAVVVFLFLTGREIPFNYGIVFDAGSTHTEMLLFRWSGDKIDGTGLVEQVSSCDAEGGALSNFARDPSKVRSYLSNCLTAASSLVPMDRKGLASLYLGATGGLRILNLTNPCETSALLKEVASIFSTQPYPVKPEQVQIISGKEEGLSGWISVNILKHTLPPFAVKYYGHTDIPTIGALDLGGASNQISFEIDPVALQAHHHTRLHSDGDHRLESDATRLHLYGKDYWVVSESFLCFGVVQASLRYRRILVDEMKGVFQIPSPCDPIGSIVNITGETLFSTPCTSTNKTAGFQEFKHAESKKDEVYTFTGTSDAAQCRDHVKRLLNLTHCEEAGFDDCLDFTDIPKPTGRFFAFSAYYHIANYFNITSGASGDEFFGHVDRICDMSLEQVRKLYPNVKDKYVRSLCLQSQYVYSLLLDGYGFTNQTWTNITFANKVNSTELGWALGFMINATGSLAVSDPILLISVTEFSFLTIILCVVAVMGILVLINSWVLRKRRKPFYERSAVLYQKNEPIKII